MATNKLNPGLSAPFLNKLSAQVRHAVGTRTSPFEEIVIPINMMELMLEDRSTYDYLTANMHTLDEIGCNVVDKAVTFADGSYEQSLCRSRLRFIIRCLPFSHKVYKPIGSLSEYDINTWMIIEGTVVRMTQRKTLEKSKLFKCTTCGWQVRLTSTYHNSYSFVPPAKCTNRVDKPNSNNMYTKFFKGKTGKRSVSRENQPEEEEKGERKHKSGKCNCKTFEGLEDQRVFVDYQQFKLQQPFRNMISGKMPQSLTVLTEGESNIDKFRPGDDVHISGVLAYRYDRPQKDRPMQAQMIFLANNILSTKKRNHKDNLEYSQTLSQLSLVMNEYSLYSEEIRVEKQLKLRQQIIDLFCPGLYDRDMVKLGVLLCVLGGVGQVSHQTRIRGQSHLLLIGEPGTGKSVVLQAATQLVDRAFFINAIGSTSAGLTVSHTKEKGAWILEPGALVLADQGVCCIDELNLMNKKDIPSLLEAMQQQTISSAKAGIIGRMNCRTSVIGACNPIQPGQKFNKLVSMHENTGLDPPLISRFDLILVLVGTDSVQEDLKKTDHILQKYIVTDGQSYETSDKKKKLMKLKAVLGKAKEMQPQIKHGEMLQNYFVAIRKQEIKTIRALESLCRLTEAHAKLMLRSQTTIFDCISVIMLMNGVYTADLTKYETYQEQLNEYM